MIIVLASYFEGSFSLRSVYFSCMSFLIVAGLFLCYERFYDHIIDREMSTNGMGYMLIHILLIFAMNNITTSLEFMRDETVALRPKLLFLVGSLLLFFLCLFALQRYARPGRGLCRRIALPVGIATAAFAALMMLLRENMAANILVSAVYVLAVYLSLWRFCRTCL